MSAYPNPTHVRLHDVPEGAKVGDTWSTPKPSLWSRSWMRVAEVALRIGGKVYRADDIAHERTDHRFPYEFDGVEWVRTSRHSGRVQYISRDGCHIGFYSGDAYSRHVAAHAHATPPQWSVA